MAWYHENARALPWRERCGPYRIWVAEIMLQQTRVAAVVEHYNEFMRRFPTLVSLALASELEVLVAWSGLGYYNRARLLHKAAQFIVGERKGRLPATAAELRTLPGIGEYTAAAIASIAFGEGVAVVDGNVERVVLRLTGRASENTAAARGFVRAQAQALLPQGRGTALRREGQSGGGAGHANHGQPCGRPQSGDDGAGRDGLSAARAALQRVPCARAVPHTRRASRRPRARRSAASPPPACWTCASAARPPRSCWNAGPRTPV